MKKHAVTGEEVPDESARVPLLSYQNTRPADWPHADFIVGNPPFIGTARMRDALGDGYTEAVRSMYPDVPESADFVMYWWHKAAALVREKSGPLRPHHHQQPPPDLQPPGSGAPFGRQAYRPMASVRDTHGTPCRRLSHRR